MEQIAEWVAPAATIIAAMMTAANLGARITGWGFVVFTLGSLTWSYIGISTGQTPLVVTNLFLTAVNAIGVWRWLGRQATFEDGGAKAAADSLSGNLETLCSTAGLAGRAITGANGQKLGSFVDAMLECGTARISYAVVTDGDMMGLNETLRAVAPDRLHIGPDIIEFDGGFEQFADLPVLEKDNWPKSWEDAERQGSSDA